MFHVELLLDRVLLYLATKQNCIGSIKQRQRQYRAFVTSLYALRRGLQEEDTHTQSIHAQKKWRLIVIKKINAPKTLIADVTKISDRVIFWRRWGPRQQVISSTYSTLIYTAHIATRHWNRRCLELNHLWFRYTYCTHPSATIIVEQEYTAYRGMKPLFMVYSSSWSNILRHALLRHTVLWFFFAFCTRSMNPQTPCARRQ